jgi:hypothetical protein
MYLHGNPGTHTVNDGLQVGVGSPHLLPQFLSAGTYRYKVPWPIGRLYAVPLEKTPVLKLGRYSLGLEMDYRSQL